MKNYLLLAALAMPLVFGSCKKDDDDDAKPAPAPAQTIPPLTDLTAGSSDPGAVQLTTDLLTGTKWKLTNLIQTASGTLAFKDLYTKMPSCQRDDVYSFSATGNSVTVSDRLDLCAGSPATRNGTWSIKNSANISISVTGLNQAGLTGDFNVIQISESEMVLKQTVNGLIYIATFTEHIPTNEELFMNKNWKLTSEKEYNYNGMPIVDLYANYAACQKDNFMRFESNGQHIIDEGATKCSGTAAQQVTYQYYYSSYYNEITIVLQGGQYVSLDIMNLNNTTLETRQYYYNQQGNYVYKQSVYTTF